MLTLVEQQAWQLYADVDDTLLPRDDRPRAERREGCAALNILCEVMSEQRAAAEDESGTEPGFVAATGRTFASLTEHEDNNPALARAAALMDAKITAVGTAVHLNTPEGFVEDPNWPGAQASKHWRNPNLRANVLSRLSGVAGLELQPAEAQGTYKISFEVSGQPDVAHEAYVAYIASQLGRLSAGSHIIFSGGQFLDIVPVQKGDAALYVHSVLAQRRAAAAGNGSGHVSPLMVATGDSMNDSHLLSVADFVILPGNADTDLRTWAKRALSGNAYQARAPFAGGVLEGLRHYGLIPRE